MENEKIISEIKTKLKGKSYKEISEILMKLQSQLMEESIF